MCSQIDLEVWWREFIVCVSGLIGRGPETSLRSRFCVTVILEVAVK